MLTVVTIFFLYLTYQSHDRQLVLLIHFPSPSISFHCITNDDSYLLSHFFL